MDPHTFRISDEINKITSLAKADARLKYVDDMICSLDPSNEELNTHWEEVRINEVKYHEKLKLAMIDKRKELVKIENTISS